MELMQGSRAKASPASKDRLRDLLQLHFHPERGSLYWLRRQGQLGWNVRDRVRSIERPLAPGPHAARRSAPPFPCALSSPRDPRAVAAIRHRRNRGYQRRSLRHRVSRRRVPGRLRDAVPARGRATGFPRRRSVAVGRPDRPAHHRQGGARTGPANRQHGSVQRRFRSALGEAAAPKARWPASAISNMSTAQRSTYLAGKKSASSSSRRPPSRPCRTPERPPASRPFAASTTAA